MAAAVNYTAEQTAELIAEYKAGETVESLAEVFGKSVRSIVAKLSREGVYVAKARTTKTGEPIVKKDLLVDTMQFMFGLTDAEADSLTKANKTALQKILQKWAKEAAAKATVIDMTDGMHDAD